ncbi:unnamed protein product [Urochloa decumbens]|uniref:NADH dehydrogenase-like complex N n=1 Tax=Urochloa decumbens TaxID=240449 RepID=A0ABC9A5J7_9POAL
MWSAAAAAARAVASPLPAPSLPANGRRGVAGARVRGGGRAATVSVRSTLWDFVGGDLVKPDIGRWLDDVEEHKALAIYPPHEGGYEGRYLNHLRYQGYYFLDLSARGLGDPETTLTKIHPVCPPSLGRQPVARWYFPPEVDYRLSLLHPDAKGLVVWIMEAKVIIRPVVTRLLKGPVQGRAAVPGHAPGPPPQSQGHRRMRQLEEICLEATEANLGP